MPRHRAGGTTTPPGSRLVTAGAVVFFVGVLAVAAVFVPFLFGDRERGLALSLATFLTVVGLGMALVGLLKTAKSGRPPS